ncbi:MAG TPA: preprotein translocase subunit SecA [Bacteroidales bacterium]|nr:preprotein translocase subunit SecA [Bacteroidales bacterium]
MSILDKVLGSFLGTKSDRDLKEIQPYVDRILEVYPSIKNLSNDELRARTESIRLKVRDYVKALEDEMAELKSKSEETGIEIEEKEKIYEGIDRLEKEIDEKYEEILNDVLPEVFSIVKDTARRFTENDTLEVTARDFDRDLAAEQDNVEIRGDKAVWFNTWMAGGNEVTWDMIHYDVQLFGGVVLHWGRIAEMATGEGKTLVATLPVFLNALTGKGVNIVTVNDYLAKRDSEWMGPIYQFHGLTVGCIDKHQPNSDGRRKAYNCDITFGTNNEFGFDYLRDNMALTPQDLVQRKHNYAIVDEVDSVLIDDARTPLIISGPIPKGENQEFQALKPRVESIVDVQRKLINQVLIDAKKFLQEGNTEKAGFMLLRANKGLPKNKALIKLLSEEGNKSLLLKTENTYMQENSKNMHIVTDDLYFVIDEKQNTIEITDQGIDMLSSPEEPDFFILPDIGSEIAEIEKSTMSEQEKLNTKDKLLQDYAVKSERVHTVNQLLKAYTLFERDIEYVVIDNKVKIVDEQTGRIMEGRRYSDGLHQAIEAKENVKVEAATQTFATITLQNYFRMYHKLAGMTGTAETEAGELWDIYKLDVVVIPTNKPIIRDDREDLVYKTKREKYNAVIDEIVELVGKGRPVLVGTTSVEISELLSRMLKIRQISHNVLNAKLHQREAEIVAEAGRKGMVTIATNMAGRGTDIKLSEEVRKAGGLAIVGTARHESRRVDRQLRGRAGRQGDPGSSQFYVSLEDDLMRLFGSERISGMMDKLGLKEGEMIQHSMISKSIERAQKKVEENNFGIRKRLLEYDDVMNSQREVIYKRRKHALYGERLSVDIANMMFDVVESIVNQYHPVANYEEFRFELIRTLSIESPVKETKFLKDSPAEITETIYDLILKTYKRKEDTISKQAYPVIKDVFEKQSAVYENIVVPVSDGTRIFRVISNLKKAYETEAQELVRSYEKTVVLATIDDNWKEHLRELDDLKQSVQNATYEQKDPLLIYKFESFDLFQQMIDRVNKDVVATLMKGHIPVSDPNAVQKAQAPKRLDLSKFEANRDEAPQYNDPSGGKPGQKKTQPVRVEKKVGRNDPCPCGSGKKYKNCHGKAGGEAM